jgi:hypothetical protein
MQEVMDLVIDESFQFAQVNGQLPETWILLDNQPTVNIFFSNKALLKNDVKPTNRCMQVHYNTGWTMTNLMGRLLGYPGKVWFNPDSIAKNSHPVTHGCQETLLHVV